MLTLIVGCLVSNVHEFLRSQSVDKNRVCDALGVPLMGGVQDIPGCFTKERRLWIRLDTTCRCFSVDRCVTCVFVRLGCCRVLMCSVAARCSTHEVHVLWTQKPCTVRFHPSVTFTHLLTDESSPRRRCFGGNYPLEALDLTHVVQETTNLIGRCNLPMNRSVFRFGWTSTGVIDSLYIISPVSFPMKGRIGALQRAFAWEDVWPNEIGDCVRQTRSEWTN